MARSHTPIPFSGWEADYCLARLPAEEENAGGRGESRRDDKE
jgi:hypothetical protein